MRNNFANSLSSNWTPYYLSNKRFGDRASRLRGMPKAALRKMIHARKKVAAILSREIQLVDREIDRQRPKLIAYYWFDADASCSRFALARPDGSRRRDAHPLRPSTRGGKYPPPHSSELTTWLTGKSVTHVIAETGDHETSPECIAKGKHTTAAFIKWWRQIEQDHDE